MNRKMRKGFFFSFLILSYVQVLSGLALQDSVKSGDQDFEASKSIMSVKEIEGYNNVKEDTKNDLGQFADKHHHAAFPEKAQKGKGSYGGSNVVHQRPAQKSAAPVFQSSCILILISISTLCIISLLYHPVFPFLIV